MTVDSLSEYNRATRALATNTNTCIVVMTMSLMADPFPKTPTRDLGHPDPRCTRALLGGCPERPPLAAGQLRCEAKSGTRGMSASAVGVCSRPVSSWAMTRQAPWPCSARKARPAADGAWHTPNWSAMHTSTGATATRAGVAGGCPGPWLGLLKPAAVARPQSAMAWASWHTGSSEHEYSSAFFCQADATLPSEKTTAAPYRTGWRSGEASWLAASTAADQAIPSGVRAAAAVSRGGRTAGPSCEPRSICSARVSRV
eukprot:scaffold4872_cov116-Isochrysis_galbana.AAC.2